MVQITKHDVRGSHAGTFFGTWMVFVAKNPAAQKVLIGLFLLVVALRSLSSPASTVDHDLELENGLLYNPLGDTVHDDGDFSLPQSSRDIPKLLNEGNDDDPQEQQEEEEEQANEISEKEERDLTLDIDASVYNRHRHPILVLSLPNHYDLVLPRYLECLGFSLPTLDPDSSLQNSLTMARHWRDPLPAQEGGKYNPPLGQCLLNALLSPHPKKGANCGNFHAWLDLQYIQGPKTRGKKGKRPARCFDPVLYPESLEKLPSYFEQGATIVHMTRNFDDWYASLPRDLTYMWSAWCNPTHDNAFPSTPITQDTFELPRVKQEYQQFYDNYNQRLENFVQQHAPKWKYVPVDLSTTPDAIEAKLIQELLPLVAEMKVKQQQSSENSDSNVQVITKAMSNQKYWSKSMGGSLPTLSTPPEDQDNPKKRIPPVPAPQARPQDLQLPMLITGLPKSGTTTVHDYFSCALGVWATAHQWVLNTTNNKIMAIGDCMYNNLQTIQREQKQKTHDNHHNNRNATTLLKSCGHARVFSDIGIIRFKSRHDKGMCFYPSLSQEALEAFYQMAPYGTILHLVRDPTAWYLSCRKWQGKGGLMEKWSRNPACSRDIFPPPSSSQEAWESFYHDHNTRIRQFVAHHPTLHYLEIPLAADTGRILEEAYGYSAACWGHANPNDNAKKQAKKQQ